MNHGVQVSSDYDTTSRRAPTVDGCAERHLPQEVRRTGAIAPQAVHGRHAAEDPRPRGSNDGAPFTAVLHTPRTTRAHTADIVSLVAITTTGFFIAAYYFVMSLSFIPSLVFLQQEA